MGCPTRCECQLDELGYYFVRQCITIIESRGLDDQGLYRVVGVNSRVSRLMQICLDRKNVNPITGAISMPDFSDPIEWETKTITSALKNYLRNLSEPLLTFRLHVPYVEAAKLTDKNLRFSRIDNLTSQLPPRNYALLSILIRHLRNVSLHSEKNLMTVSNLSICFGPTLLKSQQESISAIMDIKYSNTVVNVLIEGCDKIFSGANDFVSTASTVTLRANAIHSSQHNMPILGLPSMATMPPQPTQPHQFYAFDTHYQQQQQQQLQQQQQNEHLEFQQLNHINHSHNQSNQMSQHSFYAPSIPAKTPIQYPSNIVRTLYACVADSESELSFGPNEIITDVRPSVEVGWLEGLLNGRRGLVPANYVQFI
ncbi:Rho GTPase-activating protein 10 [Fragariocoptes setiger]|uniref:Rho GTPase-activating protein 10 n=1 Tax=Fragariocoptes setiger TaxID=1670756 RepID=A0ABQ7S6K2_9ACAR|nr:Rho GTPase-activating protein 10 [Fragariocoptes setiger]